MNLKTHLTVILLALLFQPLLGQELKTPPEGKALVYLTRVSGLGVAINFKYFQGDKYLGKFNGKKYIVLECEPGEHLFWASSENRDFLPATLEANQVYIIDAGVKMGGVKARVDLVPVLSSDEKTMEKVNQLIAKKEPEQLDAAKVEEEGAELKDFITESLGKFGEKSEEKEYDVLNADMHQ